MRATIPAGIGPSDARNRSYQKELTGMVRVIAYNRGEFAEPVDIRFYMGRSSSASRVYCSVWLRGPEAECSGRGIAGGGGYHKPSAALSAALDSAGVTLDEPIDGCGHTAVCEAAAALARALGYSEFHVMTWGHI
jgi:hypothetical protein